MPLEPQIVQRDPSFDFEGISQLGERAVDGVVASLPMWEVCSARTTLIARLRTKLHLQVPQIFPEQAEESFTEDPDGLSVATIELPLDDPNGLVALIVPPNVPGEIYFATNAARSLLRVEGFCAGGSADTAFASLASAISEYQRNIDRAAQYVDCFNAALPYLISGSVERRLNDLSEPTRGDDEMSDVPPTMEEIREVVAELVEEGKLVAVEEIDPATGKLRLRYYAAKYAPKPS